MDGQVIQKNPRELYTSGEFMKIPHLIGFNSDEGYYFCNKSCPDFQSEDFTLEKALTFLSQFCVLLYPGHEKKVADMVKEKYFPGEEKEWRKDLDYLRTVCSCAVGELFISAPCWLAGELHSGEN
jgi:carboxylesterase type B